MKKSILLAATLVILLQACKTGSSKNETSTKHNNDTIPVKLITAQPEGGATLINASGQFTTEDETLLSFKVGGVINRVFVKEGDAVVKGQILATLQLTEINAQVQQATIAYEKALRDQQRAAKLYTDSVATLEQMQNSKTALEIARQQLSAAQFNQQYAEIRATTNGYVLRKLANDGQIVAPGAPIVQINGAGQNNWVLKVAVSDKNWAQIQEGNHATINTEVMPNQIIKATVSGKTEGIDPITGTFTVTLKMIDAPTQKIAAGLFGTAQIETKGNGSFIQLPYDALLDGDAGVAYVFITRDRKTAEKIKVSVHHISNGFVSIDGGLQAGDEIITTGNAYLNDHSPIRILNH
ncbi:MAG: hypothetical protein RLY16_2601 [Bacteroidota bacterium]|jgi:RND family efflux transporter MFP subunit